MALLLLEDASLLLAEDGSAFLTEDPGDAVDTPPTGGMKHLPMPRITTGGLIHQLTLTADLGQLTAHANARIEFADDNDLLDLIKLL